MKVRLTLVAAAILVAASTSARAAEGVPSNDTLAAMGLTGLNVISDNEGLNIRGMGYNGASAFGQSFAVVSTKGATAGSTNGYKASGKKLAAGANLSFAEVEVSQGKGSHGNNCYDGCGNGGKPKNVTVRAIAGGGSIGLRK